jgi:hypothetical protein
MAKKKLVGCGNAWVIVICSNFYNYYLDFFPPSVPHCIGTLVVRTVLSILPTLSREYDQHFKAFSNVPTKVSGGNSASLSADQPPESSINRLYSLFKILLNTFLIVLKISLELYRKLNLMAHRKLAVTTTMVKMMKKEMTTEKEIPMRWR